MKSYEQMAKDVLKRRDEYLFKKQQRKIAFKHYMPMAVSLCFAVLVGLGVWQELKKLPETPPQSESKTDTSLDSIISETSATEIQSEQISQTTITNTTENMINTTFTEPTELIMTSTTSSNANTIQTSVITTITTQEQAETNTEEKFPISTIVTAISQTNASTSKIVTTSVSPTEATAIVNTGTSKTTITSTQSSTVISTTTKVSESEIVIPPTNLIESTKLFESTEFIESTTVSTRPPDPIEPDTTPEFMEPTEIETSLPTPEQYKTCILETQEQIFQYKLAYSEVSSDKIAGYLQQVELTSYDAYGSYDNYYANAYEILNISPQDAIAVKFDDEEYFIYININLTSEQQDLLLARLLR